MADLLIDSGFLYAVLNRNDTRHVKVTETLESLRGRDIVLPSPVIVETAYLLLSKLNHREMRAFLKVVDSGSFKLECVQKSDLKRIREILEMYADSKLDFADAAITALAERLGIKQILTVDQRDFRMIRPNHCDYFEILPS